MHSSQCDVPVAAMKWAQPLTREDTRERPDAAFARQNLRDIVREDNQGFAPDCFLNARIESLAKPLRLPLQNG